MKKNTAILISLLLFFFKGTTQTHVIDSLQHLLLTAKEDSNKVKLLLALGDVYAKDNDIVQAKYNYKSAGDLSRQIHYAAGIINYLFDYTDLMVDQGLYDSSLALNEEVRLLAAEKKILRLL